MTTIIQEGIKVMNFNILQLASQGSGGGVSDKINLDVHAINELQSKGFPPTDDSFKYEYSSSEQGQYGNFPPIFQ